MSGSQGMCWETWEGQGYTKNYNGVLVKEALLQSLPSSSWVVVGAGW